MKPVFTAEFIAQVVQRHQDQVYLPTDEQATVIESSARGATLVIAGAGSGKTETLANRVVWLVANGLVRPEQILGLTFTVKAAGELNERVRKQLLSFTNNVKQDLDSLSDEQQRAVEALESSIAQGFNMPTVSTYNSFASQVVTEFGAYAGITEGTTLIDKAQAITIAESIVAASEDPRLLRLGNRRNSIAKTVLDLEQKSREHLVESLGDVTRIVREFETVLELPKSESQSSKVAPTKVTRDLVQKVRDTEIIVELAQQLRDYKRERGLIEYSDQVANAVLIAERFVPVKQILNDRYKIVLLDEVQDTSVGQTRLLSQLFAGSAVMGVGDPHQTIYAWRGAAADALNSFLDHFSTPETAGAKQLLTLSTSWRNPGSVLSVANALAKPLREHSPVDVPELTARDGAEDGRVDVAYFDTAQEEMTQLAAWIEQERERLKTEDAQQRYPTCAVLVRKKPNIPAVVQALARRNIPYQVIGKGALFETPEVTELLVALRCVYGIDAENDLIRFLSGPRFNVSLTDIAQLRSVSRWFQKRDIAQQPIPEKTTEFDRVLVHADRVISNIDVLELIRNSPADHVAFAALSREGVQRLKEAAAILKRLRPLANGRLVDLVKACERELRLDIELGAHPKHADAQNPNSQDNAGKVDARANIDAFVTEVANFEATQGAGQLAGFLNWVGMTAEDGDVSEAVPEPTRGTVQVMTMHRAKGLEWDIVALPCWREGQFPGANKQGDANGWVRTGVLPDELRGDRDSLPVFDWQHAHYEKEFNDLFGDYKTAQKAKHLDEERRLAYVAVTRTVKRLRVSGAFYDTQTRGYGPSVFLKEIAEHLGNQEVSEFEAPADEQTPETTAKTLQWPFDTLGERRDAVEEAAHRVAKAQQLLRDHPEQFTPSKEVAVMLAEYAHRDSGDTDKSGPSEKPGRVNASAFHSAVNEPEQFQKNQLRPIPQRPYRGTDLGNRFHEWVERRFTTALGQTLTLAGFETTAATETDLGAASGDEVTVTAAVSDVDDFDPENSHVDLATLIESFEASRWADRQAVVVEQEITIPFAGERLVCKIDAVFEHADGTIEIVDWKTGRFPRGTSEQEDRMYQLELYRYAYAKSENVDPQTITATLFYVASGKELALEPRHSFEELESKWLRARKEAVR